MKTLFIALISVCITACGKEKKSHSGVVGRWQLVERYVSIGGPGSWQKPDPKNPQFVTFEMSGAVRFEPGDQYSATSYRITSDSTMVMIRGTEEFPYRYKLLDKKLELHPPCIEGCGSRYIAVEK